MTVHSDSDGASSMGIRPERLVEPHDKKSSDSRRCDLPHSPPGPTRLQPMCCGANLCTSILQVTELGAKQRLQSRGGWRLVAFSPATMHSQRPQVRVKGPVQHNATEGRGEGNGTSFLVAVNEVQSSRQVRGVGNMPELAAQHRQTMPSDERDLSARAVDHDQVSTQKQSVWDAQLFKGRPPSTGFVSTTGHRCQNSKFG